MENVEDVFVSQSKRQVTVKCEENVLVAKIGFFHVLSIDAGHWNFPVDN